MRKTAIFTALALVLLLGATPALAQGIPKLPHAFYGSVSVNGAPAADGTQVSATVNIGEIISTQNPVTTVGGKYGSGSPYLLVQGYDIPDGATIKFYVSGVEAEGQTATFIAGGGPTQRNLTVTIPPTIGYSPSNFSFTATAGGANPPSQTLSISNSGVNPLAMAWSVTDDATWLSLSPGSGSSSGEVDSVTLSVSISGMTAGTYSATITILAPGATNTPRTVPVSLTVAIAPPVVPPVVTTLSITGLTATVPLRVDAQGIVQTTTQLATADDKVNLNIPAGTKILDAQGNPLTGLTTSVFPSPPPPPAGTHIIGLVYDLGPDGATFAPPITLTFTYDPATLPEGVAEKDLVVARYDEVAGQWVELPSTVNEVTNTITVLVSGFSKYGLFGKVTPPPLALAPAAFSLSNLTVSPAKVQPKELVTITVSVANTGDMEGSYTVVLKLNGVKEAEKSVTVAVGASEVVTFSVIKDVAGSYSVTVNGLTGSFTVVEVPAPPEEVAPPPEEVVPPPPPPVPEVPAKPNWGLIGGIIAAVVVIGLLIFFLVRRRRAY